MLKQTDNFVKNNIDSASSPVRVCVAICDFGKQHLDKIARKSAYFEAWYPQYVESLKHDIPQACLQETFNPLYIKDIFETAILPRITSQDGNGRLPLNQAQQNIWHIILIVPSTYQNSVLFLLNLRKTNITNIKLIYGNGF